MAKDTAPTPEDLGIMPQDVSQQEATETVPPSDAPPKARRGRPPKSGGPAKPNDAPKKSASRKAEDVDALGRQITGIHQMIAIVTGMHELVIKPEEGQMLARAVTAVTEEYGFAIDGKTGAALQLFGAAAMIYVPRALMIKARVHAAQQSQAAQDQAANDSALDGNSGLINPVSV